MSSTPHPASGTPASTGSEPLVGIQVGAISFVDEGVDEVIDTVRDRAGVNALFVATQAFDRGVAGRQVTWKAAPGHGPDDLSDVHVGGSFVTQHPELYAGSVLGPYRAPDAEVAGFDVLGDVVPAAHERGVAGRRSTSAGMRRSPTSSSRSSTTSARATAAAEPRFVDLMVDVVLRVLAGHRPRFRLAPREGPGGPEAANPHTEAHADVERRRREGGS